MNPNQLAQSAQPWLNDPVVQDEPKRPKWMDAPIVEPAQGQARPKWMDDPILHQGAGGTDPANQPPQLIEFEGQLHQFPGNFTQQQISKALKSYSRGAANKPSGSRPWENDPIVGQEQPQAQPEAAPLVQDEEGTWLEDLWRWGTLGSQGFNQGLTQMVELPYDALNNAPRLVNLLPGEQGVGKISEMARGVPILGDMFPGEDPYMATADSLGLTHVVEPETPMEKIVERGGEEIGASVLPFLGVAKRGSTLAKEGKHAYDMGLLDRAFVAPFKDAPVRTAGAELASAAGAGVGAQAANNHFGDDSPTAELIGALAGGIAAPFAAGGARTGYEGMKSLFSMDDVARKEVGRRLVEEAADPSVLEMPKLQSLVDQADTTGINPTVGQATNDPGLKNLEYSRLSGANAGRFAERRAAQSDTLREGIERTAPIDATDDSFLALLDQLDIDRTTRFTDEQAQAIADADMWLREGEISADEAQRMIDEALGSFPDNPTVSAETASRQAADRVFGNAEDSIINQQRRTRNELYAAVPNDVQVPTSNSRAAAQAQLDQVGRAGTPPASVARIAGDEAEAMPMRQVRSDLTALGDDAAAARLAGRPGEARTLQEVRSGVQADLESAGEANDALRAANRNDSENYAPRFREGVPAKVRAGSISDDKYLAKALKDPVEADRLAMTIEGDEAAQTAVRDWLIADLGSGGAENMTPARADKWLRDNGAVLERFPEVRSEVQRLRNQIASGGQERARAQEIIEDARKLSDDAMKMEPEAPGEIAELYRKGETQTDRMKKVLSAPKSREKVAQMVNLASNAQGPQAAERLNGLKRGFVDFMMEGSDGAGGIVNQQTGRLDPGASKRFLDRYGDHIDTLYRDSPQHARDIKAMLESVAILDQVGPVGRQAANAQKLATRPEIGGVPLTSVMSRLFAAESGRTSYRYVFSEGLGQILARARAKFGNQAINRLLDEALLDPELAAVLAANYNKLIDRKATKTIGAVLARLGARGARAGRLSYGDVDEEGGEAQ